MSLLLCKQEDVRHPYYIEILGIHIYSSQELCYVIYHNPLMALDGFVGEELVAFIRDELKMVFLADKLEKYKKSGEDADEMLVMILQECAYYTALERNSFRQQVVSLRRLHPAEFAKKRADYLFGIRQYARAAAQYQEILETPRDRFMDDAFIGRVWNNLGAVYARLFQFDQAFEAFRKSYQYTKEYGVLKKLYEITLIDPSLQLGEHDQMLMDEQARSACRQELDEAREKAAASEQVEQIDRLFEKDPIKRASGAQELIRRWKKEYRNM